MSGGRLYSLRFRGSFSCTGIVIQLSKHIQSVLLIMP